MKKLIKVIKKSEKFTEDEKTLLIHNLRVIKKNEIYYGMSRGKLDRVALTYVLVGTLYNNEYLSNLLLNYTIYEI